MLLYCCFYAIISNGHCGQFCPKYVNNSASKGAIVRMETHCYAVNGKMYSARVHECNCIDMSYHPQSFNPVFRTLDDATQTREERSARSLASNSKVRFASYEDGAFLIVMEPDEAWSDVEEYFLDVLSGSLLLKFVMSMAGIYSPTRKDYELDSWRIDPKNKVNRSRVKGFDGQINDLSINEREKRSGTTLLPRDDHPWLL